MSVLPTLHIRLLGDFHLSYDGRPATSLDTSRLQALLAYLVLHRDAPQSRRHLAFLFWPDSTEAQARTNLRHLLHDLKHALPAAADFLTSDTQTLQWRSEAPFSLDVIEFERAVSQADSLQALQGAADLYQGDLLPSCYADWILPERERLHQQYIIALERLVAWLEEQADYHAAIRYTQRLLVADPLREVTYRNLIHLHARIADQTGVIRIYKTCLAILEQELGVPPSVETRQAYEQALNRSGSARPVRSQGLAMTLVSRSHNLPVQWTSFIGREQEKEEVHRLLAGHRLVTLTGPGGSGKTRLAVAVAADVLQDFADGVWWVDLAPLADEALVVPTVAATLALFEGGRPLLELLTDYLSDREVLLIMDNCEHVRAAAGGLAKTLLAAAPNLRILATSRASLNVKTEIVWSVPALSIPHILNWQEPLRWPSAGTRPGREPISVLTQYESIQLFLDRAITILPTFALTRPNVLAIGQICQRLDGLPLAIELAAARVKVLSAQQIATRLDNALPLLTQGSPAALPHQQTVQATLDWSYNLLSASEQRLFRSLACFAGSFTLAAVEAVGRCYDLAAAEVLDLLSGLVEKSLVAAEYADDEARFRLHEIVRQYAQAILSQVGEAGCVYGHHLSFFLSLAETAEPHLRGGSEQVAWLNRLELEHDNLRAALQRSLQDPAALTPDCTEASFRLTGALWLFWFIRGHFYEGRRWVDWALETGSDKQLATLGRSKALYTAASFAYFQGNYERAELLSDECIAVCRETGDSFGLGVSLHHLGNVALDWGDVNRAETCLLEGLNLARSCGEVWLTALLLNDLGNLAASQGQFERAITFYTENLALSRQINDKFTILYALLNTAEIAIDQGYYQRAKLLTEESLALSREIGEKRCEAFAIKDLSIIARHEGHYEAAGEYLQESLVLLRDAGDRASLIYNLRELATLAQMQGAGVRATHLLAAIAAACQLIGLVLDPVDQAKYDASLATLRTQLDEVTFTFAWNRGEAMSLEQAIRYALEVPSVTPALN